VRHSSSPRWWARAGRSLRHDVRLYGAGCPLRQRAVQSPDPARPWPDLRLAWRMIFVSVRMEAWAGRRRRWRQRQLRRAVAWQARGCGGWPALRACGGHPHGMDFGGIGPASIGRRGWGPLVLVAMSGGARAISGLSEFFLGWSWQWSGCSDLRSRGLLMVGGGVGGDGSLPGGGSRGLPCPA
jgi:hypothetical protein